MAATPTDADVTVGMASIEEDDGGWEDIADVSAGAASTSASASSTQENADGAAAEALLASIESTLAMQTQHGDEVEVSLPTSVIAAAGAAALSPFAVATVGADAATGGATSAAADTPAQGRARKRRRTWDSLNGDLSLVRAHFLSLLASLRYRNGLCNSLDLQEALLEMAPRELRRPSGVIRMQPPAHAGRAVAAWMSMPLEAVQSIVSWFSFRFVVACDPRRIAERPLAAIDALSRLAGGPSEKLALRRFRALAAASRERPAAARYTLPALLQLSHAASLQQDVAPEQHVLLLLALLRGLQIPARLVFATDCISPATATGLRTIARRARRKSLNSGREDDADAGSNAGARKRARAADDPDGRADDSEPAPFLMEASLAESSVDARFDAQPARRLNAAELRKAPGIAWWVEAYCAAAPGANATAQRQHAWVAIDAARGLVNMPVAMESCRLRSDPFVLVMACSKDGALRDVTRRYTLRWSEVCVLRAAASLLGPALLAPADAAASAVQALRRNSRSRKPRTQAPALVAEHAASWLADTLRSLNVGLDTGVPRPASAPSQTEVSLAATPLRESTRDEGAENTVPSSTGPKRKTSADDFRADDGVEPSAMPPEAFPTNAAAYAKHPLYALQSKLGATEAIAPNSRVLGYFKGQPIYSASDVHVCKTSQQWLRDDARVVAQDQLASPAIVSSKKFRGAATPVEMKLYGPWQTVAYVPPAWDPRGPLPRNQHGNFELFRKDLRLLPPGLAYVEGTKAKRVASSIGVEFVEALVDFERRAGMNVPVRDGVIVREEHALAVREGCEAAEQAGILRGIEKHNRAVLSRWAKLVRGVLIRARLSTEYGSGGIARDDAVPASAARQPMTASVSTVGSGGGTASAVAAQIDRDVSARQRAESQRLAALHALERDAGAASESE